MLKRQITPKIKSLLSRKEFIAITGPRQAGKTTLLGILKEDLLDQEDIDSDQVHFITFQDPLLLSEFESDPVRFVTVRKHPDKITYLFLDEFQFAKNAGQSLKLIYDTVPNLKVIMTGSSSLEIRNIAAEMVGRILHFQLWQLSYEEIISNADYPLYPIQSEFLKSIDSIGELFLGKSFKAQDKNEALIPHLNGIFENYITYGGYPAVATEENREISETLLQNIYNTYVEKDIIRLLQIGDASKFFKLLRYLAINIGNLLNHSDLQNDLGFSYYELQKYLDVLQQTFIIISVAPLNTNKINELKKSPVVYFTDLGLRNWIIRNFSSLEQRQDNGFLLENYVYLRLRNYVEAHQTLTDINFWRKTTGGEVDFVITRQGEHPGYIPVEVKYSNFDVPKVPRSMRSFISEYKPDEGIVINRNYTGESNVEGCRVKFVPAKLL